MKIQIQKYVRFFGRIGALVLLMMGTIAGAVWLEPTNAILPNMPGWTPVVPDYQLNHALLDSQHKNYMVQPAFVFSVGAPAPIYNPGVINNNNGGGIGGASAFSPFLALVSGNFTQIVNDPAYYSFPEATYVEGMKIMTGNINATTRPDNAGGNPTLVPGFIRGSITGVGGSACTGGLNNPCNVLFLEGGDNPVLPAGDVTNDMVNIFLGTNSNYGGGAITTNRFGIERASQFASLRMGQVYADKAFVGGEVTAVNTVMNPNMPGNFVGNFLSLPDASNLAKPEVLQGEISYGVGTTATTKFSNIGYGDYCYLQNPQVGAICPDGFFLSKYDGRKEAICRSFNPSPNPQAVTVKNDFRRNINLAQDVDNHIAYGPSECKSTPPSWVCSDGLDNDGDGQIDYLADPGCEDAYDMSEYNIPTPPTPVQHPYVTTALLGPYLGKSCNIGVNTIGYWRPDNERDYFTYIDMPPYGTNPQASLTPLVGEYSNVEYAQYWRGGNTVVGSPNKIPEKYDLIVAKGHYGKDILGVVNWQKIAPLFPGWYFIHGQINPMYKVKVGAGNIILDVKVCQ
jgi:hypothetical protein